MSRDKMKSTLYSLHYTTTNSRKVKDLNGKRKTIKLSGDNMAAEYRSALEIGKNFQRHKKACTVKKKQAIDLTT